MGNTYSSVFILAKTGWFTTSEGIKWEKDFLKGKAAAKGVWESTTDYVQRYIDIGILTVDPDDRNNFEMLYNYM